MTERDTLASRYSGWGRAFEIAVEAAPCGMLLVKADGTIELVNREAERLFGYEPGSLIGQPVEQLVPQRFRGAHPTHRHRFGERPQFRAMGAGTELFAVRRDGEEFPVEVGLNPVQTEAGTVVLTSVIDMSERRRFQRELERSNAELEQFAYVASHDLQEPLRMVRSYTELLMERYADGLDERGQRYLQYAHNGARRMQQLIADLLEFSRVSTQGRLPERVSLADALHTALEELRPLLEETRTRVDTGPLPSVWGDRLRVVQLFRNLISNAIKFRSEAPPHVCVAALDAPRSQCKIEVRDNGIGVAPEHADRIFEIFQRLHTADEIPGTGLGLALCRRIVELQGGKIWLEPTATAGATFCFTLPLATPAGSDE